jgi:cytochrome b subunit of formate dehydrogenase
MVATATRRTKEPARTYVVRNNRRTRWFHAGVYVIALLLLGTGLWLLGGQEGRPSVLARLTNMPDTQLHTWMGWAFTGLSALGVILGWRAAITIARSSVRFQRGDLQWFARWPRALLTGQFRRHSGHFDPGQRIMNFMLIGLLAALIGTGVGLATNPIGLTFVWLDRVHRWATYLFIPALLGHVVVAAGILPGYRGVWRAMHLGGRLPVDVARRLWPDWTARHGDRDVVHDRHSAGSQ